MPHVDKGRADSIGAGAPEVTEEMYRAGSRALEAFYLGDGVYDLRKRALSAMYRAMDAVRYGVAPVTSQTDVASPQCESSIVEVVRSDQ
jgi:hypothetical protein